MDGEDDRLVSGAPEGDEQNFEQTLRPRRLADYVGQQRIKDNLGVFLQAARERGEPLDHVLLYGPPGLGKTTLAHIISHEMDVHLRVTSGPSMSGGVEMVSSTSVSSYARSKSTTLSATSTTALPLYCRVSGSPATPAHA